MIRRTPSIKRLRTYEIILYVCVRKSDVWRSRSALHKPPCYSSANKN